MPLTPGNSRSVVSENIRELHTGKTFAHTAGKFGKKRANAQAVAIALSEARKGRAMGGVVPPALGGAPNGLAPTMGPDPTQNQMGPPAGLPNGLDASQMGVMGLATGGPAVFNSGMTPRMGAAPSPTWIKRQEGKALTKGPILSSVPGRTDAHKTHVPSGSYVIPADIVSGRGQGNTIAGANALQKMFKMGPYGAAPGKIKGGSGLPKPPKAPAFAEGGAPEGTGEPVRVNLAGGEIVVPPEHLMDVVHPDLKQAHEIMDRWVLDERKLLRKTLAKLPGPVRS